MEQIKIMPHGKQWKVAETFHWHGIDIPKGFVTNLASIPRIFWGILPPFGLYSTPCVIHDYLYYSKYNRKLADHIFRSALREYQVPEWQVKLFYFAVRCFGWIRIRKRG